MEGIKLVSMMQLEDLQYSGLSRASSFLVEPQFAITESPLGGGHHHKLFSRCWVQAGSRIHLLLRQAKFDNHGKALQQQLCLSNPLPNAHTMESTVSITSWLTWTISAASGPTKCTPNTLLLLALVTILANALLPFLFERLLFIGLHRAAQEALCTGKAGCNGNHALSWRCLT